MLDSEIIQKIELLAAEACEQQNCRLYDVEFSGRGGTRTLRVFIDVPGAGVTVDQCAKVSNSLSLLLDVEDVVGGGAYDLEVSSPGLERLLKKVWHYQNAIGKKVKINTKEMIPWPMNYEKKELKNKKSKGKKSIEGVLKEANEEHITLESQGYDWVIPQVIIHKSNIVFEMKSNK